MRSVCSRSSEPSTCAAMFSRRQPAVRADLGGDHDVVAVAARGHPLADDPLRGAHVRAHVRVGGVDEVAAGLDVGVEHGERRVAIRGPAEHVPAEAEPEHVQVHPGHPTKEGARWAPSKKAKGPPGPFMLASPPGCSRVTTRGRRGVLELLLGAEQGVEHLLAQPLGEGERDSAADDAEQQDAAEAAALLLLLGRLVQRDARVAHAARGLLDVLLELLVLEDLRRRALAVAQPGVGVTGRLVGLHDVLAQVLVVDEPLDVRVGAGRLSRLPGLLHLLVRHRSLASRFHKDCACYGRAYPGRPFASAASNTSVDLGHPDEVQVLAQRLGDVLEIRLVAARRQHAADARALGGERLLLQAADRQHLAGQRQLAGHGHVVAHRAAGDERHQRRGHRDPRARAVLRDRARRHVDMDVVVGEPVVGQVGVPADVGERGLRRLLHHVAELAGDRQLALAGHRRGLDEQHVAADRRPRQPGGHARLGGAALHVGLEARRGRAARAPWARSPRPCARGGPRPRSGRPCGTRSRSRARGCARPASRV